MSASAPVPGGARYRRRRPEQTQLYQLVERYYPDFAERLRREGRCLPAFVEREFEGYLKCGRLEHGFLRVRCTGCHAERLVAFSCKHRGFSPNCGARRMVDTAARTEAEKRRAMSWARRLKRVFRIDIETCMHSGGKVRIIACIQDPDVIRRILDHLKRTGALTRDHPPQAPRAPPQTLFPCSSTNLD